MERSIATISVDSEAAAEHLSNGRKLKPGDFGSASGKPMAEFLLNFEETLSVLPMGELHITLGVVPQLSTSCSALTRISHGGGSSILV